MNAPASNRDVRHVEARPATLIAALAQNAAEHASVVAMRERKHGIWTQQSWSDLLQEVLAVAAGLEARGLAAGQAVNIIGDNSGPLYRAMLAAMTLRAFPVPVFADVPAHELAHYARHGSPRIAVAGDQEQVDKLLELRETTGQPELIIYEDPRGLTAYKALELISYQQLLGEGRSRLAQEPHLASDLLNRAGPDDIAVLLHSSGTTGVSKGVPLVHRNLLEGVLNARRGGLFCGGGDIYAYLPMAWVGDFVFSLAAAVVLQSAINIPERQETVLHDMRQVAPTWYLAAPRAWDNMLTRVQVGMAESTSLKRLLFNFFMPRAIAMERKKLEGKQPTIGERIVHGVGEILIYGPLKDYLGLSRAQHAYTGGEAMGEDTFLFFRALGINLKQFYGQTETCALTAAHADGDVKVHTVGKPMPGVEMRIEDSGEILVKSPSVVPGYYNEPAETAKAFKDGWLRTGDAGYFEPDGHLVVLGRVSEVVRTAGGERYIPNYIENRIKFSPYIRNVAVMGTGRPHLTAIVCIDLEAVGHWAEEHRVCYTSYADLSQKPEVYHLITTVLRHVNGLLKPELRIKSFVNLHKDFDPDDGEITRTRKLRRSVIEERYEILIDALYSGQKTVDLEINVAYRDGGSSVLRRTLTITHVD